MAKALRDSARTNPALVVKGGLLGTKPLSADEVRALAELPSRDVLLAQVAGAMAAPMQQFAGLLQALPRNFAYGLKALIDERGGAPETDSRGREPPSPSRDRSAAPEAEAPTPRPRPTTETETTEETETPAAEPAADTEES